MLVVLRMSMSDGTHSLNALINNKPEINELLDTKKDAVNNCIASVRVKVTPHPKIATQKLAFIQSLQILQEGVAKIGDPQKYEAEDMAKATIAPAVAHEQEQVRSPSCAPLSSSGCLLAPSMPCAVSLYCTIQVLLRRRFTSDIFHFPASVPRTGSCNGFYPADRCQN